VATGEPSVGADDERAALEDLRRSAAALHAPEEPRLQAGARRLAAALERLFAADRRAEGGLKALASLRANLVGTLPEQLRDLKRLLSPTPVTLADLPPDLSEQMLAPDGRARIQVVPRENVWDSRTLERFVDSVRAVAPEAAGSAVWLIEWGRVTWRAMLYALVGGVLCMSVFLIVLWRSAWDPALAFFPLLLAALLTCASLALLGQSFNFANVIVLPMLIGMSVDSGVHLVHRHRTNPDEADVLASSTARAVFVAAVTTLASFGSLGMASHQGIAAIGQLLTVGVAMTLLCYMVVLPAVLEWDDRRRRPGRSGV
jgi:hypothetical protein